MYEILDKVNSPADIKGLTLAQLKQLCAEVRAYMVDCCSRNPGHLASSLGAVELIIGFHYLYDSPDDKIVFDVGHQAYAHKIITGRKEAFRTCRTADGISGFPRRDESGFDAFGVGHSSTSVSAALGLAEAARLQGREQKVVALIGDGALTGGLAFEGLNNAGASHADLLVILNDNNQSIDRNRGGLHEYLLRVTTSHSYNRLKTQIWDVLGESRLRSFIQRWVRSLKSWFVKKTGGDLFEALGFRYFGPIDGNDLEQVIRTLRKIKRMSGPRLVHCITRKGKGYAPAEADPVTWHSPGKFNPETGERIVKPHPNARYQDVFGKVLLELAKADRSIVGITPAMASGCGMNLLAKELPGQFFDVGIEEEHAVTFSAGLAAGGMKPFCNLYSSFSQRAYDQIIHDVALQRLPVVLCLDRAGLVGEDGPTHHGLFDLAALRSIPGCVVCAPKDELELKQLMYTASKQKEGPFIIRYPRGMGEGSRWEDVPFEEIPVGKAEMILDGDEIAVLTTGPYAGKAAEAARKFGRKVAVWNFRFVKPLDTAALQTVAQKCRHIITVEDGTVLGGLHGAVAEFLSDAGSKVTLTPVGIPDEFVGKGRQDEERKNFGLDCEGIEKRIKNILENTK